MRNSEIRLHVRAQGKQSPTIPLNAVSLLLGSSDWTLLTSFIDTISTPSCREPLYFRSRRLGSVPVLNVGRAAVAIGSPRAHRVFIKTVEISLPKCISPDGAQRRCLVRARWYMV